MARVRSKDSRPELLVRRLVFSMGFRYRLHVKDLPGCPDLVFRSRQKVIFVHGCFWHRHKGYAFARMLANSRS
jgi:DNA mismatch endonuclease (patch repair protein)